VNAAAHGSQTSWPPSLMTPYQKYDCQLTRTYLKNNPAKFHPNPIGNDGALGFFETASSHRPNKNKKNNRMCSNIVQNCFPLIFYKICLSSLRVIWQVVLHHRHATDWCDAAVQRPCRLHVQIQMQSRVPFHGDVQCYH